MEEWEYILDGKKPVKCSDLTVWAKQCEERHVDARKGKDPWRVAKTMFGNIKVSTVFLGIDHRWGKGPPILFETMIFGFPEGHELHDYQERCSTWQQAEQMHKEACQKVAVATA